MDFDLNQLYKALTIYFINHGQTNRFQIRNWLISIIFRSETDQYYYTSIQKTIEEYNLLGRIVKYRNDIGIAHRYMESLFIIGNQEMNKRDTNKEIFLNEMCNCGYISIISSLIQQKYRKNLSPIRKILNYMHQAINVMQHKRKYYGYGQMVKEWRFDKKRIDELYKMLQLNNKMNNKENTIVSIYEKHIDKIVDDKENDFRLKYASYQLIQYLITITEEQFQQEFNIQNDKDIQLIIEFIEKDYIDTLYDLRIKLYITKHLEYSNIYVIFQNFELDDITDEMIVNMLDNVENRILCIKGDEFIIARRIYDNRILKSTINEQNRQQIEDLLQQCHDRELYDIIITSKQEYKNLRKIRIRYLNYVGDITYMTMKSPQDLISASLFKVQITNLNKCINLINLCSQNNRYNKKDVQTLHNLHRISNKDDEYTNQSNCFMHEIIKNNCLKYVYFYNWYANNNIVASMEIKSNIKNIQYFFIYQYYETFHISLNLTQEVPENLRLYKVYTKGAKETIFGHADVTNALKAKLINETEMNG